MKVPVALALPDGLVVTEIEMIDEVLLSGLNLRSENLCGAPDSFCRTVGTGDTASVSDRPGPWSGHWRQTGRPCHGSVGDTDVQNDDFPTHHCGPNTACRTRLGAWNR